MIEATMDVVNLRRQPLEENQTDDDDVDTPTKSTTQKTGCNNNNNNKAAHGANCSAEHAPSISCTKNRKAVLNRLEQAAESSSNAASSSRRRRHRFSITSSGSDWEDDLASAFHRLYEYDASAHELLNKVIDWTHTSFQSLPEWLQDNEYLHKFHRPQLGSFYLCCKSIFRIHSETGNIWTHLIGMIIFLGALFYYVALPSEYLFEIKNVSLSEKLAFIVFCVSAVACMACSAGFHTFGCHSVHWARVWCKLDYAGIACMIAGSFVPWIHYGFYCQFFTKVTYMSIVAVLSIATIIVCMFDKFSEPQCRVYRAAVFAALGLFGIVPFVHLLTSNDVVAGFVDSGIPYLIAMAAFYITGAALYACRIPERFWPGKFDILFQSHQLFHCCVVIAALVQLRGIRQLALWRMAGGVSGAACLLDVYNSAANEEL